MAILGIDEVGRGPLAGPLVIGAVILPDEKPEWTSDLRDSKKLSAKKREALAEIICAEVPFGLGWVTAGELDSVGISEALRLAARRAVKAVQELHVPFSQIIIDGKVNFLTGTPLEKYVSTAVKADDLIKEVSAASIVAKVARDKYMCDLAAKYPEYGFDKHVGYGTAAHMAAISKFGITPEHRKSFEPIKSMVGFERPVKNVVKNTTFVGNRGEDAVCDFLKAKGHQVLARNFKTKIAEIDIVSFYEDKLYFTEVKYRKNSGHGTPLEVITKEKQRKMRQGAEIFVKTHKKYSECDMALAAAAVTGEDFVVNDWFVI
ncbi:ribonuclease HII [Candidatus Saccharibacteria bacterium]|nr:ribonuclease HII [Candidatus Saccharibacteria bacterium]